MVNIWGKFFFFCKCTMYSKPLYKTCGVQTGRKQTSLQNKTFLKPLCGARRWKHSLWQEKEKEVLLKDSLSRENNCSGIKAGYEVEEERVWEHYHVIWRYLNDNSRRLSCHKAYTHCHECHILNDQLSGPPTLISNEHPPRTTTRTRAHTHWDTNETQM